MILPIAPDIRRGEIWRLVPRCSLRVLETKIATIRSRTRPTRHFSLSHPREILTLFPRAFPAAFVARRSLSRMDPARFRKSDPNVV